MKSSLVPNSDEAGIALLEMGALLVVLLPLVLSLLGVFEVITSRTALRREAHRALQELSLGIGQSNDSVRIALSSMSQGVLERLKEVGDVDLVIGWLRFDESGQRSVEVITVCSERGGPVSQCDRGSAAWKNFIAEEKAIREQGLGGFPTYGVEDRRTIVIQPGLGLEVVVASIVLRWEESRLGEVFGGRQIIGEQAPRIDAVTSLAVRR